MVLIARCEPPMAVTVTFDIFPRVQIRHWGGALYQRDEFFLEADARGILVFQVAAGFHVISQHSSESIEIDSPGVFFRECELPR